MLEALYNLSILVEVGLVTNFYSNLLLNYLWSLTLRLIIQFDLLEIEEINQLWDYVNRS